nr:synaptobrevin homolog YKT6-like [Parasteatoda tepidariorum]
MVAIYFLAVLRKNSAKSVILSSVSDLSEFGFFQKRSVKEFMHFSSVILVERTEPDVKVSVQQQGYMCNAFVRPDNLAAVVVTDDEYPTTKAHTCLTHLLNAFSSSIKPEIWALSDADLEFPEIKTIFKMFSNPVKEPVSAAGLEEELDETKIILHKTVVGILRRGENLDDLIRTADDISEQSKAFYKSARKSNSCCTAL